MTDTLNHETSAADAAGFAEASAADIVAGLTIEEKASLTSGADFWTTKAVEQAGLPSIMLTDGPHGVRRQREDSDHLGIADSVPATCFPPAVALGSSFDAELLERVGAALGDESQARAWACCSARASTSSARRCAAATSSTSRRTRWSSGVLGSALVRGLQSQGVGASLKHFAANNQETDRMRVSADIDERPLREIYLRGFQRVVERRAAVDRHVLVQPAQRGLHLSGPLAPHRRCCATSGASRASSSPTGAPCNDRVTALVAGLDLEMPSNAGRTDAEIVAAVRAGELDEAAARHRRLACVELVAEVGPRRDALTRRTTSTPTTRSPARPPAASIVLLKNDDALLPLAAPGASRGRHRRVRPDAALPGRRFARSSTRRSSTTRSTRSVPLAGAAVPFAAGLHRKTAASSAELARRSSGRGIRCRHGAAVPRGAGRARVRGLRPRRHRAPRGSARTRSMMSSRPTRAPSSCSRTAASCASPTWPSACPRSSRAGCSARPAAARSPTCSTVS